MQRLDPRSREEVLHEFPIEDDRAPGWYFKAYETSNCVWRVEGQDAFGRGVGRSGTNREALLAECAADAASISESL
jgi:hypothetical protein